MNAKSNRKNKNTRMKRLTCGFQFELVATIDPERDSGGAVREFNPGDQSGRALSDAPFCRFVFPTNLKVSGVYAITLNDRVVYVGKTNTLSRRFGHGEYGDIVVPKPGNPQVTNRRVNHGILDAARRGNVVQVWFHETTNRDTVEATLIGRLHPLWNRKSPSGVAGAANQAPSVSRSDWPSVIRAAEAAKAVFLTDRTRGEALFADLLEAHSLDGMVWLKRAQAYEQTGDTASAHADFARAEALLPFPGRKAEARAGLRRTRRARLNRKR